MHSTRALGLILHWFNNWSHNRPSLLVPRRHVIIHPTFSNWLPNPVVWWILHCSGQNLRQAQGTDMIHLTFGQVEGQDFGPVHQATHFQMVEYGRIVACFMKQKTVQSLNQLRMLMRYPSLGFLTSRKFQPSPSDMISFQANLSDTAISFQRKKPHGRVGNKQNGI